jgi:hypothetical protein
MYSIASVFDVLRSIEGVALEDDTGAALEDDKRLSCPLTEERCSSYKDPDNCEEGNNQSCKQSVTVFYKQGKLRILCFRFKISRVNRNGFIPKEDSTLAGVIKYLKIDRSLLELIKPPAVPVRPGKAMSYHA